MILSSNTSGTKYTRITALYEYLQRIEGWYIPVPSVKDFKLALGPSRLGDVNHMGVSASTDGSLLAIQS